MAFPRGRIGTHELLARTGLGKTTFFTKFRHDPYWIERLDIRLDHRGRLHMKDEAGLRELLDICMGRRADHRSKRADNLARPCSGCGDSVNIQRKACPACGMTLMKPFFEAHGGRIETILSDNGREFCGRPDRHPYELFLQLEGIEHRTTKVRRPQSNGFIERFHRTLLDEHLRTKGRTTWYETVGEMQESVRFSV
jgi:hypothetical protein